MNRNSGIVLLAVLIVLSAPSTGLAQSRLGNFYNGERYLALTERERNLFVMALWDMQSFMFNSLDIPNTGDFVERIRRCIPGMNSGTLRQFFDDYLNEDPRRLVNNIGSNFSAALNTKCPR